MYTNKYVNVHPAMLVLGLLALSSLFLSPLSAQGETQLKVSIQGKSGSYTSGDTLKISWTPASTPIQSIAFIPTKKNDENTYYVYSDIVSGDPIITSGSYSYTFSNFEIPSGSYYVGIALPGDRTIVARSAKVIKVESRPSLYFGTADGSVNSVSVDAGDSVTLKWEASSVKNCKASSIPANAKWKKTVKSTGTKKIRVSTPTTFFLTCKNNLGEITGALDVDTEAPERSTAKLIPSTTFINTNFRWGTTQGEALSTNQGMSLFNSSATEPIYFRFITKDQPRWVNTGYSTSQITIPPHGTTGLGAFTDPSMVSRPGTYTWDLKIEGNFSNSPLVIPVTMKVTP